MPKNRGSILLPILLVSTIALSIALAVASRSLKGLKTTGETEQSSSAYSAAEAGIEQALYTIETGGMPSAITTPVPVGAGGYIKKLKVEQGGGGSDPYLVEGAVAQDDVVELKLNGYGGTKLTIYWANQADYTQASELPSLVINYVYGNLPYSIKKGAVNCAVPDRDNGFVNSLNVIGEYTMKGMIFRCKHEFCVSNSCDASIPVGATPQIVRLRPMYNKAEILVNPDANLPSQMLTITATGQAGETERTVEVTRSKPSLPAIFDFVLFSASEDYELQKGL